MTTTTLGIRDRSSPKTTSVATRNPQGIRILENTVIGTWDVKNLLMMVIWCTTVDQRTNMNMVLDSSLTESPVGAGPSYWMF